MSFDTFKEKFNHLDNVFVLDLSSECGLLWEVGFSHPRGSNFYYITNEGIDSWYVSAKAKYYFEDELCIVEHTYKNSIGEVL